MKRLDWLKAAPQVAQALFGLQKVVNESGLEHPLLELVKMRASQLNGCAYCLDMHSKDLRVEGESEQRLYMISAWREASCYNDRERAALAFAEAVTRVGQTQHVSDAVYAEVRNQFSEEELVDLTIAVLAINSWNRINVAFQTPAGDYQPGQFAVHA